VGDQSALTRRSVLRSMAAATTTAALGGCTLSGTPGRSASTASASTASGTSVAPPANGATTATPSVVTGWNELRHDLVGPLFLPGQLGFAAVANGYNPRYDGRSPAAVARCSSAADVAACVRYATNAQIPFSLRSGGHSYTGWSSSAGLVVDVSPMAGVQIDRASGVARIGAGAKLIDVYQALGSAGVGIPAGSCPSVGMAGLTLGGGFGVLSRAWGLTSDNLRGAEVVLGDGRVVRADANDNSDLFWALRGGGGGSFGAATSFDLAIRPAPEVQTYFLRFSQAAAAQVLDGWQRWAPYADRRLWSALHLSAIPSTGVRDVTVAGTWIGPARDMDGVLNAFVRTVGAKPTSRSQGTHSYLSAMLLEAGCKTFERCHLKPRAVSFASRWRRRLRCCRNRWTAMGLPRCWSR
jgi:FAD/FMN-containing dehydrogenase